MTTAQQLAEERQAFYRDYPALASDDLSDMDASLREQWFLVYRNGWQAARASLATQAGQPFPMGLVTDKEPGPLTDCDGEDSYE